VDALFVVNLAKSSAFTKHSVLPKRHTDTTKEEIMKKIVIVAVTFAVIALANTAFANPTSEVLVTYTAPKAKAAPAATPKVNPAKLGDALKLHAKFRHTDGEDTLAVSAR